MKGMLRTSEFWMSVLGLAGMGLSAIGVMPKETFDQFAPGIAVYVAGRFVSKGVKSVR